MPTPTAPVSPAVGIDLSTHQIHLALVGRDSVLDTAIVGLDKVGDFDRLIALGDVLRKWHADPTSPACFAVIEKPYYGRENPDTSIRLSILVGFVQAVAVGCGYGTRLMLASEWRPLAGVGVLNARAKRVEMKRDALRLVRIEYKLATRDDNLAEAILMGRVAVGLARREALA